MIELVLISDSHGRDEVFEELRLKHPNADAYLHAGDSECDQATLGAFISVQGNNDRYFDHPIERFFDFEGVKVWMSHGHQVPIFQAPQRLSVRARELGVQLCLYGHSHVFKVIQEKDLTLVNPGSIHYNRDGSEPSYALIHIDQGHIRVTRCTHPRARSKRRWF
jgi:putative phosphoesterase